MTTPFDWSTLTIPRMLEATTHRHAAREALVRGDRRLSYERLLGEVFRFANAMLELGVQPGDRVGVWLPNYVEWVVANLGTAAAGAVTVPLNSRFRATEAEFVLRNAEISVLVTTERFLTNNFREMLEVIGPTNLPALRHIVVVGEAWTGTTSWDGLIAPFPTVPSAALRRRMDAARPSDAVNMFYTSGTTALPKGALNPHTVLENIWNVAQLMSYTPADRCLVPVPLFYTTGNYWGLLIALMTGACSVPLIYFTPEEAVDAIEAESISVIIGIPNMLMGFVDYQERARRRTTSMRTGWSGGALLPVQLVRDLRTKLNLSSFHQVYGMTETGGITTITQAGAPEETVASSIGRLLPGFEVRLVDPDTGADVGVGGQGELWLRSRYLLKTYYGMPPEQLASFFPGDGWYRTGDILSRNEQGDFFFHGRAKDLIKVGGENLSAREVEDVLYGHPAVRQVAVFGIPDRLRNEAVVAVVQAREPVTADEVRAYCRERLAPFKVPRHVVFREALPLTPTGKIQKFELRNEILGELEGDRGS